MIENSSGDTTFRIHLKSSFNNYKEIEHFLEKRNSDDFKDVIEFKKEEISNLLIDILDAKRTNSFDIFIVETKFFKQFIDRFIGNILINWNSISTIENVKWDLEILEKGKDFWDWKSIQLNPKLVDYFDDFKVIQNFSDYLDWKIITADKRLIWSIDIINKFKNKINFKNNVNTYEYERYNHISLKKCFQNFSKGSSGTKNHDKIYFYMECFSEKEFLNDDIISEFSEFWKWEILSSNSSISTKIILKFHNKFNWFILSSNPTILKDEVFFYENLHLFDLSALAQNPILNIDHLRFFKRFYEKNIENKGYYYISINDVKKCWYNSFWSVAFKSKSINWSTEFINEFIEILNNSQDEFKSYQIDRYGKYDKISGFRGSSEWESISSNLTDKNAIFTFKDKLDFISLAINNKNLVWDIDLIGLLLKEKLPLVSNNFNVVGLPGVLGKIKITKEAIIHFKYYWFKDYDSEYYHRNSDGTELRTNEFPLWHCFNNNKNIIWDIELNKIFYTMEFNLHEKVIHTTTGKKAIIVATKHEPWKKENDIYMRKEIFPENDYLILFYNEIDVNYEDHKGLLDVFEFDLEKL